MVWLKSNLTEITQKTPFMQVDSSHITNFHRTVLRQ